MLNRVGEKEAKFNFFKNKMNENNLGQRSRYSFRKHEIIDRLGNAFLIDLETFNDQEVAEAYAVEFYIVNRLRDKWDGG